MGHKSFAFSRGLLVIGVLLMANDLCAGDLLIENGRLFDATGKPPLERMSVLVRNGRIAAIGPKLAATGIRVLDVKGATILPGLVDTHVHFTAAPGTGRRNHSPETIRKLNRRHLRAYLACGVTTVLDPGIDPDVARDIQGWLASGNPGPRFLTLGPIVTAPGGYPGNDRWGPVSTVEEVESILDLIQSLGAIGVKVAIERGWSPVGEWNIPSAEIRDAIVRGAASRSLPIYVHATSEEDQAIALDMNAYAIAHPVFSGRWIGQFFGAKELSAGFIERMSRTGTYQMTTLSFIDMWPASFDPSRLDDRLTQLTVPEIELETARDPEAERWAGEALMASYGPAWLPGFIKPLVGNHMWNRRTLRDGLRRSQRALKRLHDAGVPIVIGSDTPSPWPEAFYMFHGTTTLREIELLSQAGLSPEEAIAAATRIPAEMLGLADEIGTVEVGKRADLAIVEGDPLADPRALRSIRWTVKDGVAKTPEKWMRRSHRKKASFGLP